MNEFVPAFPDFASVFEATPKPYLLLDAGLHIVAANEAYRRTTFTTGKQIVGRPFFEAFADEAGGDGERILLASLQRVLTRKRADTLVELKYSVARRASEGGGLEPRYWTVVNSPVLDAKGEVRWIINSIEDVTRNVSGRHVLEAQADALRKSTDFFDSVIENIPAMIAVKDARDLHFVLINRAGEELTGIPRAEMIGKTDYDLFPLEQAEHFASRDRDVLASWQMHVIAEEQISTRHKGARYLTTTTMALRDEHGQPKYLLAMSSDITDRKLSARKLKELEDQLNQALKMEAIGNLTGGVAHDFNNFLSAVIGNLDLLREQLVKGSGMDELANEALQAALRGAELTQRLLAFARRQPLQPRIVDVNELIEGVSRMLGRTLGANVEISQRLAAGAWPVVVDPVQLEASLVNLAANARDAMPRGGNLHIRTDNRHLDADYTGLYPGLRPGDYTLIEVTDSGVGMTRDVLDRIFEPFFTTKQEGRGTGLGLSMVFGFMKQSEGHINVYSEPGVGTTFRLYLPRATAGSDEASPASTAFALGGEETILAVEDNPALRRLVVRQLRQLGYRCLEAKDGPSALKMLEKHEVHLLFSDVIMPGGLSGYELGREARTRWPELKVLLTSGFPEEKLNGNGSAPWNMRLLIKPYRKEDLALMLREVLADTEA